MFRVLIVDDEKLMREALRIMVSKVEGFRVVETCSNGQDAIDYCKNNPVDIVFMDIVLPGMTGLEASKEILSMNKSLSIYVVSAYKSFELASEAMSLNIKEYLLKPVSFSRIKKVLLDYEGQRSFSIEQSKRLISLVNNNDFKAMNRYIITINKVPFDNTQKCIQMYTELKENILTTFDLILDKNTLIYRKLQIVKTMVDNDDYLQFWLFRMMDYVFKQKSIAKYPILESVFVYIDENIRKNIGLKEIINECTVSQGYLSRIFKQQFKVSVMEYIHMRKIMLAKEYFIFTSLSIADVAFNLGYNESNYFSKVFKKYEGMTVVEYKNANISSKCFNVDESDDNL